MGAAGVETYGTGMVCNVDAGGGVVVGRWWQVPSQQG